jgi:hypothetical protein
LRVKVIEELHSEVEHHALTDEGRQILLAGTHRRCREGRKQHRPTEPKQRRNVALGNGVVDDVFDEYRRHQPEQRRHDDRQAHERCVPSVGGQIGEDAAHSSALDRRKVLWVEARFLKRYYRRFRVVHQPLVMYETLA